MFGHVSLSVLGCRGPGSWLFAPFPQSVGWVSLLMRPFGLSAVGCGSLPGRLLLVTRGPAWPSAGCSSVVCLGPFAASLRPDYTRCGSPAGPSSADSASIPERSLHSGESFAPCTLLGAGCIVVTACQSRPLAVRLILPFITCLWFTCPPYSLLHFPHLRP